ncbi:MAG TPA: ERCC4 domain-containing protein [Candidatus Nanoarchaeia archaeon]|nr:ERCC4 domain-containing protein [Candidatus Nanoarchaeia archaeon]
MNKLNDIFSSLRKENKEKTKKEIKKIIIDHREKASLVPSYLRRQDFEIEFKQLNVADYLLRGIAIERKTIQDFINSMLNKRLSKQIKDLQQYKKRLLIIEGIEEEELYYENEKEVDSKNNNGLNPNSIRGFLLSITLKYNIPIIYTKNEEDTAKYLEVLNKKSFASKDKSWQAQKINLDKYEQLQFVIESFPGIGPKTSRKLLERFGTIQNIILAPTESLEEVLGKKAETVREIIEREYKT